jgi:hypothetical protein
MAVHVTEAIWDDLLAVYTDAQSESLGSEEIKKIIKCQVTLLKCEHGRSQALEGRLRNEIDLVRLINDEAGPTAPDK